MTINRKQKIQQMLSNGKTLDDIGKKLGISRQRVYQLMIAYGIETPLYRRRGFWTQQPLNFQWLRATLNQVRHFNKEKLTRIEKDHLFDALKDKLPEVCPILGTELNYNTVGTHGNNSLSHTVPSIDRIDSSKGYEVGNVHIISYRANRIKNDGTAEEHRRIADYMEIIGNNNFKQLDI